MSGGGSGITSDIAGGLMTALGTGLMFVPGGQAIGLPMMMGGIGGLAGGNLGGYKGMGIGMGAGTALGGLAGLGGGLGGIGSMLGLGGQGAGQAATGAMDAGTGYVAGPTTATESAAIPPAAPTPAPTPTPEMQLANLGSAGFPGAQQMSGIQGISPTLPASLQPTSAGGTNPASTTEQDQGKGNPYVLGSLQGTSQVGQQYLKYLEAQRLAAMQRQAPKPDIASGVQPGQIQGPAGSTYQFQFPQI